MGTTTISLADDAYERLRAAKREGESFSDVVRRLTAGVNITEFHGAIDDETADALAETIRNRRAEHRERRADRMDGIFGEQRDS